VVAVLALFAVACGGGAEDKKGSGGMGAGASGNGGGGAGGNGNCAAGANVCGNCMVETAMGEQCEMGVPVTATCQSMGMGPGMVLCNPASCKLMMMCTEPPPVGGATGQSGRAGTGG
jgi:hypothetical protein